MRRRKFTIAEIMSVRIANDVSIPVEQLCSVRAAHCNIPDVVAKHVLCFVDREKEGARCQGALAT
jgi:hypothetical protein